MNRGVLIALLLCSLFVSLTIAQTVTPSPIPSVTPTPINVNSPSPSPSPKLFTPSPSATQSQFVSTRTAAPAGRTIQIDFPNLIPQGIAWSSRNGFLVTSLTSGTIYSVGFNGALKALYQSQYTQHTAGLRIDAQTQRLLVTNTASYPQQTNVGNIVCLDLATGAQIFSGFVTNVGGALPVFVNQVALDSAGNAYATDSYSGRIFVAQPTGRVSLFFSHPLFMPQDGYPFGITGIEVIDDEYLIVVVYGGANTAKMYQVPFDSPSDFFLVQIQGLSFPYGLTWNPNTNTLFLVTTDGHLQEIQSSDRFTTAKIVASETVAYAFPTTVTLQDGIPFVIANGNFSAGPYYIEEITYDSFSSGSALVPGFIVAIVAVLVLVI